MKTKVTGVEKWWNVRSWSDHEEFLFKKSLRDFSA